VDRARRPRASGHKLVTEWRARYGRHRHRHRRRNDRDRVATHRKFWIQREAAAEFPDRWSRLCDRSHQLRQARQRGGRASRERARHAHEDHRHPDADTERHGGRRADPTEQRWKWRHGATRTDRGEAAAMKERTKMFKVLISTGAAMALVIALALSQPAQPAAAVITENVITGAGAGIYPAGATFNGIQLAGSTFGF